MKKTPSLPVAACLCSLAASCLVHADVKLTANVTVTEGHKPGLGAPDVVTTYFKGGNAREEISTRAVIIFNATEGQVYTLDVARKTFYAQTLKEFLAPHPDGSSTALKVNSDLALDPGGFQKVCAGQSAKVFELTGTVTLGPPKKSKAGGGLLGDLEGLVGRGGIGTIAGLAGLGGGGRHGGDGEGHSAKKTVNKTVEVSGEYWLADTFKLPDDKMASPLWALYSSSPMQNFVFGPLADQLAKRKQIPLDSRITMKTTLPDGSQKSVTRTTTVTEISQTPLPEELFLIPTGYSQVAPPL